MLGIPEPHVRPILAGVVGTVDAIADRDAVPHPRFTRPDPHDLGIRRIDGDRTDRLYGLLVEYRLERGAAVGRLPHAAARRADIDRQPRAFVRRRDRRDTPAHRGRADVARAQSGDRFGIDFDGGGRGGGGRGRRLLREYEHQEKIHGRAPVAAGAPPGRLNRGSSSGTLASILSNVTFPRSVLLEPFGPDSDENGM